MFYYLFFRLFVIIFARSSTKINSAIFGINYKGLQALTNISKSSEAILKIYKKKLKAGESAPSL